MFIKSSLRGQKVHKSMNFVHDLATLILVALARVSASNWFNINQLLALTRASATRIKTRDSGLPMYRLQKTVVLIKLQKVNKSGKRRMQHSKCFYSNFWCNFSNISYNLYFG